MNEDLKCANCGRNGRQTKIVRHHIIPRNVFKIDYPVNRMPLCHACERYIHYKYKNKRLASLWKDILKQKDVQLFGLFVDSPMYVRHADVRDIDKDFIKWKFMMRSWIETGDKT